jgi:hypothetical protein
MPSNANDPAADGRQRRGQSRAVGHTTHPQNNRDAHRDQPLRPGRVWARRDLAWHRDGDSFVLTVAGRGPLLRVVPDARHRAMWRVADGLGGLSGLANLTRARDAAAGAGLAILKGGRRKKQRSRHRRCGFRARRYQPSPQRPNAPASGLSAILASSRPTLSSTRSTRCWSAIRLGTTHEPARNLRR